MDYLHGPDLISCILKHEEPFSSVVRGRGGHERRVREMEHSHLEDGGGAMAQECGKLLETRKGKDRTSKLSTLIVAQ